MVVYTVRSLQLGVTWTILSAEGRALEKKSGSYRPDNGRPSDIEAVEVERKCDRPMRSKVSPRRRDIDKVVK